MEKVKNDEALDWDFKKFKSAMEKASNKADAYVGIDDEIARSEEAYKEQKKSIEAEVKKRKTLRETLRGFLSNYMAEKGYDKLKGEVCKSISLSAAEKVVKEKVDKQIMIKGKYVSVDDAQKGELVKMLEELGVKTREVKTKIETDKAPVLRVLR